MASFTVSSDSITTLDLDPSDVVVTGPNGRGYFEEMLPTEYPITIEFDLESGRVLCIWAHTLDALIRDNLI